MARWDHRPVTRDMSVLDVIAINTSARVTLAPDDPYFDDRFGEYPCVLCQPPEWSLAAGFGSLPDGGWQPMCELHLAAWRELTEAVPMVRFDG